MSFSENPRFRLNTKQTSKNKWQIDATLEYKSDKIFLPAQQGQDTRQIPLGLMLLSMIKEAEKAYREDGRMLVGDGVANE
jgi:hypothetical protein